MFDTAPLGGTSPFFRQILPMTFCTNPCADTAQEANGEHRNLRTLRVSAMDPGYTSNGGLIAEQCEDGKAV